MVVKKMEMRVSFLISIFPQKKKNQTFFSTIENPSIVYQTREKKMQIRWIFCLVIRVMRVSVGLGIASKRGHVDVRSFVYVLKNASNYEGFSCPWKKVNVIVVGSWVTIMKENDESKRIATL